MSSERIGSNSGDKFRVKTLVLGFDGMDWQVIEPMLARGELPGFKALKEGGVSGSLTTLEPTLSPMLWTAIATGKRAAKHGVCGFTEVDEQRCAIRPVSSLSRKCKAVWNILMQQGARCHVVNWFASHPAEPLSGSMVSDYFPEGWRGRGASWPLAAGTVHPAELEEALAELRMNPSELDEEILALFLEKSEGFNPNGDKRVGVIAREMAKAFSVHAAATWLMTEQPWDFLAVYWRTPDLLSHYFMPYHPPAVEGAAQQDAEALGSVVSSTYRMFDLFLQAYIELAGPQANIIVLSDHGFQSGHLRPGFDANPFSNPEAWHRRQGILLMRGPGLKQGSRVHGARLIDIAPTILAIHHSPIGSDMDGRVLAEAFRVAPTLDYLPTWEDVPGDAGRHPPDTVMDDAASQSLIQQFVDLGYIDPLDKDVTKAVEQTRAQNRSNLARDLLDHGDCATALPLLEEMHAAQPGNLFHLQLLVSCQRRLGLHEEVDALLDSAVERIKPGPYLDFLRAQACLDRKDYPRALALFRRVEEAVSTRHAGLRIALGQTYVGLRLIREAQSQFEQALLSDAEDAVAFQGLAHCYMRQRQWELAARMAMNAIGLQHNLPMAHFYLGLAFERLGRHAQAIDALHNAVIYEPSFVLARRALIVLLEKQNGRTPESIEQRARNAEILALRVQRASSLEELRDGIRKRSAARQATGTAQPTSKPAGRGYRLPEGHEFLLVSGLPRSGTSLLMQMLYAGGINVLADGERAADEDNPEGYFEWQSIKKLPANPALIEEADGKALKVISMLLTHLPTAYRYRIIFVKRPLEEVARSQARMIERRHPGKAQADSSALVQMLAQHRQEVLGAMRQAGNVTLMEVDYPELVKNPQAEAQRIAGFAGICDVEAIARMVGVVRPELRRQRA